MKLKRLVTLFGMAALAAIVTTACPTDAGGGGSELTGTVTIEGTAAVGQTLTADPSTLGGSGTISYQWLAAGQPISGETAATYLVKAVDEGKTIRVRVTRAGYNGSVTSEPTAQVTAQTTALTGTVTIEGSPQTGQFLTANTTALGGSGTISYQWLRGSTEISGATGSSYEVGAADVGSTISVRVTRAANSGSITGGPTAAVTEDTRDALSGTVTIDGTATVGQTLTANTTALNGTGDISYQWLAGGESISGATASSYTVAAADNGKTISVRVTRADNSAYITSNPTAPVTDSRPALSGTVTITGIATVGETLTANTTNLGGTGTISYQWLRGDTEISEATASSYELTAVDDGSTISVRVTRADNSGSVTSDPTAAVADGRTPLSGAVTITGTPTVGQTLTANTTDLQGTGDISHQWIRGNTDIPGATESSYTLTAVDEGSTIKVRVTRADNSGSITSAATAAVSKQVTAPTTNAEHLAMLRNLNVNVDNPDLPLAPNGQPYDPQGTASAANMRAAVSGSGPSLGPLGNIYSQPLREIFAAGYHEINVSGSSGNRDHVLFEDFKNKIDLTVLGQNGDSDSSWAEATDHLKLLRKSVAADLDGDGIDEVVIVTLVRATDKMLINKGVYNGSNFTVTQVREESLPNTVDAMVPTGDTWDMSHIGWTLITADLNGDGKQECILTLPSGANGVAYMYLLDNNLAISPIPITDYQVGFPSGHGRYAMVTAADYDQDGKDELCLMIGTNDGSFNAPFVVLDDKDAGFKPLHEGYVGNGSTRLRIGNLVAGDFTHDGLPDTAFYGHTSNTDNMDLLLLKTSLDSNFNPVFDWVISANKTLGSGNGAHLIPRLAVGDVDADRQTDLYAANRLWTFDGSSFEQVTGTGALFDPADYFDRYDTVMGDVTGDGKDDVVMFYGWATIQIYYYDGGYKRFNKQINSTVTSHNETGCLPNVDNDSFILQDTGQRELLFTNPQVIAVLASPPYYAGINEDGDGGTSFGYSKSSGGSETHSGGFSVGVSVGYEFKVPLIGTGTEFEASMKNSFSWAQSTSKERNETWGWNTRVGEDLVIFTAIPFDVYYYKVLRSPDSEDAKVGDILTVNVPRKSRTYHYELSYYNARVPEAHRVSVNHTLGDPSSYYSKGERATLKSAAGNYGLFSLNTEINAGQGNGSSTISLDDVTTHESSFAFDVEMEVKASATFTGVKVGVSVGFSYGYETTTSVSNGTFIEGTVPSIPEDYYTVDKDFDWGLMAFPAWAGVHKYVFVTYWTDH